MSKYKKGDRMRLLQGHSYFGLSGYGVYSHMSLDDERHWLDVTYEGESYGHPFLFLEKHFELVGHPVEEEGQYSDHDRIKMLEIKMDQQALQIKILNEIIYACEQDNG